MSGFGTGFSFGGGGSLYSIACPCILQNRSWRKRGCLKTSANHSHTGAERIANQPR